MSLRICIGAVQVPFARGGAESLVEGLGEALKRAGHQVEVVNIPFKWYPKEEVIKYALLWRLLDLTESQGEKIDLFIATKFPSYLVKHPRKVLWLVHQHRQAYDLYDTVMSNFSPRPDDRRLRDTLIEMDRIALGECQGIFAISANVKARLAKYNGVDSQVLYPPPRLEGRFYCDKYGDFLLSVGRLDSMKRPELLLKAMKEVRSEARCVIVGSSPQASYLQGLAAEMGLGDRVRFLGYADDEELLSLYARCFAVFYAPYDEDFGYVALEAHKAKKPVITAQDSGGVLELVTHNETGLVAPPEPGLLAAAIDQLFYDRELCRRLGEAGWKQAQEVTWEGVVRELLSNFSY